MERQAKHLVVSFQPKGPGPQAARELREPIRILSVCRAQYVEEWRSCLLSSLQVARNPEPKSSPAWAEHPGVVWLEGKRTLLKDLE
jgi:hypothetical protein